MSVAEILGVKEKEPVWLKENGVLLRGNPFFVVQDKLVDNFDAVRDDVLGKAIRGAVEQVKMGGGRVNGKYFWVDEKGVIRERENNGELFDIMNTILGNAFKTKDDAAAADMRVLSTLRGLDEIGICLFPTGIGNPLGLAAAILDVTSREQFSEEAMPGILKECFAEMHDDSGK